MQTSRKSIVNKLRITPQVVQPVGKPAVNKNLPHLDPLSRSTECLQHFLLSLEYWLSPDRQLREWLRRNLLLWAFLFFPAILVMPTVGLLLWQLPGWLSMLTTIFGRLIFLPILVLLAALAIKTVLMIFRR